MATPAPVQHVWYDQSNEPGNTYLIRFPNASLANNFLSWAMVVPSAASLTSISDNAGNTWSTSAADSETDSTNNVTLGIFDLPNSPNSGATQLTVVFTGNITGFGGMFQEWLNLATSSTHDGTTAKNFNVGAGGAGTASIASGSGLTTTVSGDLIQHFGFDSGDGASTPTGDTTDGITKIAPASGYTLLQADLWAGGFCQYQVQGSTGATNPAAAVTSANSNSGWISITRAIKSASSGTAPSPTASRIFGVKHWSLTGTTTGSHTYPRQFPTFGNGFVCTASDPQSSISVDGITGATSGPWTVATPTGTDPSVVYLAGGNPSSSDVLTFTVNDKTGHGYITGVMYDLLNCGAFDQIVRQDTSTSFGPGNSTPAIALTPGVQNGVVICVAGDNTGPPDALVSPSGAGAQFISSNFTGMGDLDSMDNGDVHAVYAYTSNAAQSWVFHNTVATTGFSMALLSLGNLLPSHSWVPQPRYGLRRLSRRYDRFTAGLLSGRLRIGGASGPQTYFQTITPSQATSASLINGIALVRSLTQAEGVTLARQVNVTRSVAQSESLTLARAVAHSFATIAQGTTATLVKQVAHLFGVIGQATVATLTAGKLYVRAITAAVTSTATLAKTVGLIRSVSQATSLTLTKAVAHAMSLSQATGAAISKLVAHGLSLSQATAATVIKAVSTKLAAATQATAATLTSIKVHLVTLTASQATVAAIAKAVGATRSVAQASSVAMVKGVQLTRSVGQATSPALAKTVNVVRSVAQSESLTLLHTLVKFVTMTVSQATVVTLSKSAQLTRSVAQASSSALKKSVGVARQVSQASSLAMTKALTVTRAIAQTSVATLVYGSVHHLVLTASQATTATLRKSVGIVRAALQALSSALATVVTRFTQRPVSDHIFLEYSEGRVRVITSDGRARLAQEEGRARVELQGGKVRAVFEQGTIRVTLERQ